MLDDVDAASDGEPFEGPHRFARAGDTPSGRSAGAPLVAAIEFDQVTKTYPRGVTALHGVSLRIAPEEFVFIVGRTGMGKSTLMKMIYREELPTAGRVLVQGRT